MYQGEIEVRIPEIDMLEYKPVPNWGYENVFVNIMVENHHDALNHVGTASVDADLIWVWQSFHQIEMFQAASIFKLCG